MITPESFGCASGGIAEDYYTNLVDPSASPSPNAPADGDGDPGCGSGAGCPAVPGELGAAGNEVTEGLDGAEADLVRRYVAQAVRESSGKGRGGAPRPLVRWAGEVLAPPTVAWDRLLRAAIRRVLADQAGADELHVFAAVAARDPGHSRSGDARPVDHGLDCGRHLGIDVGRRSGCGDE